MPYIKQERRSMAGYPVFEPQTAGELNYAISTLIRNYKNSDGSTNYYSDDLDNNWSYQKINDVLGALEGAKFEFIRRVVNSYEDTKIKENGDVYV